MQELPERLEERPEEKRSASCPVPIVTLQWHVTARCDQACRHCYMYEAGSYQRELQDELSFEDCCRIIDDYAATLRRWRFGGQFHFTGGDPLLREDFFEILRYAQGAADVVRTVRILGNPFHLTPDVARQLKTRGVSHYQISLDSLEAIHDSLRSPGSFKASLEAIRMLKGAGLSVGVMFTLSRVNMGELLEVRRMVHREGVDRFVFDRMVPVGNGAELKGELLDNEELRALMVRYMDEQARGRLRPRHRYKSHLFNILLEERRLLEIPQDRSCLYGGCAIGRMLSVLADGRVLMCRRLPVEIGRFPNQSFAEVFVESPLLNQMREVTSFRKCSRCELGPICRGCPAVTYGVTGDYLAADPNCWRSVGEP